MDYENMVFIYNGILFSHKEEWNFVICREMDRSERYHLQWSYPGLEGQKPCVFSHMWNIDLIQI
jgi:hypothetical protein